MKNTVKKAVKLLKLHKNKIYKGPSWNGASCPIASAYGINEVSKESLPTTKMVGWTPQMIYDFVIWHDNGYRNEFLEMLK